MAMTLDLRDPEAARRFLWRSLGLARAGGLSTARVGLVLRTAHEMACEGWPIPLLGFVHDLSAILVPHIATNPEQLPESKSDSFPPLTAGKSNVHPQHDWSIGHALDASLSRRYDDYVLGKLSADITLERAADQLPKYRARQLDRALAFTLHKVAERSGLAGALMSPSVFKTCLALEDAELASSFNAAQSQPIDRSLLDLLENLIGQIRTTGELLGSEDIFELSSGTALEPYGQRLALRQTLQAVEYLRGTMPQTKPRARLQQFDVATQLQQEDCYPVGGFSSISNRGTIESLLRSELAYLDTDQRPDLFDVRFARDELLYYSRDENQFFRRRLAYVFRLDPSLSYARFKDEGANWQRVIYSLALLVAVVGQLTEWLSAESLKFVILLPTTDKTLVLQSEHALLQTLFQQQRSIGLVEIHVLSASEAAERTRQLARDSLCFQIELTAHTVTGARLPAMSPVLPTHVLPTHVPPLLSIRCEAAVPRLEVAGETLTFDQAEHPWRELLLHLCQRLVGGCLKPRLTPSG